MTDEPVPASPVLIDRRDGVLSITWNRPERLNALTIEMLEAASDAIESAGPETKVVVMTGAGRAFCTGADMGGDGQGTGLGPINRLVLTMTRSPLPIIAAVNGPAAGAGCSIALAADLTVARRDAYFLLAFINIGLMPDGGATALVAASVGRARANRMAMLGERLPADEAERIGLIHSAPDADHYDDEVAALTDRLVHGPTRALAHTKTALNAVTLEQLEDAVRRETVGQTELLAADDFAEGAAAFREKRPAAFTGR